MQEVVSKKPKLSPIRLQLIISFCVDIERAEWWDRANNEQNDLPAHMGMKVCKRNISAA